MKYRTDGYGRDGGLRHLRTSEDLKDTALDAGQLHPGVWAKMDTLIHRRARLNIPRSSE